MAELLATLFEITPGTVLVLFALCTPGSLVLKTQIEDSFICFGLQPILALIAVVIFAGLKSAGIIEPLIITDWIKGLMVAAMIGNGIGIGIILLGVALLSEKQAQAKSELTEREVRRQANNASRKRKGFG